MLQLFTQLAFIGPGGPEFIVVMLVLLVMFGAKDAPRIFRKINEMINSIRNTADGFKREIMYSDLDSEPSSYSADDDDTHDEYDYGEEFEDEYRDGECDDLDEEQERDYSDETFQGLEKDLEQADDKQEEKLPEDDSGPKGEEGDDDARKD